MSTYVVAVKPSARRANGAVGRAVHREGSRRAFPSRDAAEAWAATLGEAGGTRVWIRAANPADAAAVDGYLVSRRGARAVGDATSAPADDGLLGRAWDG